MSNEITQHIDLPEDLAIPLLAIRSEDSVFTLQTLCSAAFITVIFTVARKHKPPKCPSSAEWMIKMWYMCTTEYYSAAKKSKIMKSAGKCMDLENISNKVTQTQKDK